MVHQCAWRVSVGVCVICAPRSELILCDGFPCPQTGEREPASLIQLASVRKGLRCCRYTEERIYTPCVRVLVCIYPISSTGCVCEPLQISTSTSIYSLAFSRVFFLVSARVCTRYPIRESLRMAETHVWLGVATSPTHTHTHAGINPVRRDQLNPSHQDQCAPGCAGRRITRNDIVESERHG